MAADRAAGWCYRVASTKGVHGRIRDDDRTAMAKAGLAEGEIASIGDRLDAMQRSGTLAPSRARVGELIEEVGALPSPANLARAEPVYLRALGEALLRITDRYVSDALLYDVSIASRGAEMVETPVKSDGAASNIATTAPIIATPTSEPAPLLPAAPPLPSHSTTAATMEAIGAASLTCPA